MALSIAMQESELEVKAVATAASDISFTVDRSVLLKSLAHVQSVVEKRNTIPVLSNVKIEVKDGTLNLSATDMDIAITESVEASVKKEGELTAPAHTLYDIIRKLPDGSEVEITGDADKTGKIKVKAGSCNFSLATLPSTEFPMMEKGELSHEFLITPAELSALIEKTKFAISTEETRYYLNGIFLHTKETDSGNALCAVATDGHRLAKVEIDAPEGSAGMPGIIVPRKTVAEISKLIAEAEGDVIVSLSDSKICFECGKAVLISKLIDGNFPEYSRVIPSDNDKQMEINTQNLIKAVDRVSTITSDRTRSIKFALNSGKLELLAANEENGTAREEVECQYEAGSIGIGFNSRYVLEMLSGIEGENVQMVFKDDNSPAIVKDTGDSSVLFVIMPMRI